MLGAIVGAGLAVSGVALQALVRNVLADPFILGVSSGASTGAAAAILFGFGVGLGSSSLTGTAFLGALAATGAVLLIARVGDRLTSTRLLLAGVTVGYVLSATTSFLIFASHSREGVKAVLFWLLGSLDLLHQVGASDRVVARAGEYDVPATGPAGAAVQNKPIIDADQPSLEKILGANADMVIGYGPGKTTAEDLAGVGMPIYVQTAYCGPHGGGTGDGGQLTDVLTDITFLGQVFGTEQQATESARGLQQRIDAAKAARPAGDRKTAAAIYFLGDARYTYSDQAIVSDQMATLGLTNALGSVEQDSALNVEAFIGAKPDVVVLIYGYETGDTFEKAKQKLLAIPGVSAMKAVTSNSIVGVTGPEVEGSPIAVDGLERMARQLNGGAHRSPSVHPVAGVPALAHPQPQAHTWDRRRAHRQMMTSIVRLRGSLGIGPAPRTSSASVPRVYGCARRTAHGATKRCSAPGSRTSEVR